MRRALPTRRSVLGGLAASAVAAMARARRPLSPADRLADAVAEAERLRKPLLVLLAPESGEARWDVGGAWGDLVWGGTLPTMALLGLAEVAVASTASLVAVTGVDPGPAFAALVETDGSPVMPLAVDLSPPRVPFGWAEERLPPGSAAGVARRDALATLLGGALGRDDALLLRRVVQAGRRGGDKAARRIVQTLDKGRLVDPVDVDALAAPVLYEARLRPPGQRRVLEDAVAVAARERYRRDPAGAAWQTPSLRVGAFAPGPSGDAPYLRFLPDLWAVPREGGRGRR